MAEPKKRKSARTGRPKSARSPREIVITFKGYPEFADWVRDLAATHRLPVSILIEHALIQFAKDHEFEKDPPER